MNKPSFLTESFGRRSIAFICILALIVAVSGVAASQQNGKGDRKAAFRRLVRSYVRTGKLEYEKRYFGEAEKTFLMAKPYREYLTDAEQKELDALLNKAQSAVAQSKRALETFAEVNSLIKQDKLTEAKARLASLTDSKFLSGYQLTRIAEVLRQLDARIIDDKGRTEENNSSSKLQAAAKLEKIADEIRNPAEHLKEQNQKIADVYRASMDYYRAGKLEKARVGFAKVAQSGLIPPLMKETIDGYIARIDGILKDRITAQPLGQENPELIAVVEPKAANPGTMGLRTAQPRLTEAEAAEADPNDTGDAGSEDNEQAPEDANDAEPDMTAPGVPSPVQSEGTYIDRMIKERNVIRTYTATVVNDAAAKANNYMAQGDFDKARQAVQAAMYGVNENQIQLGEELFKAHSTRLKTLMSEIDAREAARAREIAEQKRAEAAQAQRQFREQMDTERQERIAELLQNAKAYQKQQRYEAALGQIKSLLALDPQHDEALTMKDLLEDTILFREQLEVERESRRETTKQLMETDRSQIPYADVVTYPKNWREIVAKPTRKPDKPIGLDPADAAVYDQLEEVVDLSNLNQSMSFQEVIAEMKTAVDPPLQIQPNWKDLLEFADIEPTTPAMMDPLSGVKLRKVLELLLAGVSSDIAVVDYVVDEGVIAIATEEALPDKMITRVYDITDLVGEPAQYGGIEGIFLGQELGMMSGGMTGGMMGGGMTGGMMGGGMTGGTMGGIGGMTGGTMGGIGGMTGGTMGGIGGMTGGLGGFGGTTGGYGGTTGGYGGTTGGYGGMMGGGGIIQAQSLEQLIQESIEPESWYDLSDTGEGTVTPYPLQQPKKLAVYNTHEVHEEVEKLLEELRKALGHQVSIEARFLVVSESFLEDIGLDVDFTVNAGTHWGQVTVEQESANFTDPEPTSVPLSLGGLGAAASVSGGYGSILDDLQVSFLLRATQAHRDAKSLNAPVASVLSGESASFSISQQMIFALPPIQTPGVTQVSGVGGTATNTGQGNVPQYLPISPSNVLSITPIITHDKKNVLLNIITTRNEFLGLRTTTIETPIVGGAQGGQVVSYDVTLPDQENSSMMTRVSVPDQGTLLLGGQRVTEQVETEAGVPILSKLPIVGRLFRNRSTIKDSRILLILVKPVIILQEEREAEAIAAMEGEL